MDNEFIHTLVLDKDPDLTDDVKEMLEKQNSNIRMVFVTESDKIKHELKIRKLKAEAEKSWDLFYKRNSTNFFKDRSWTTREFHELLGGDDSEDQKVLLEVGCGVGNLVFPLISEKCNYFIYACDFSSRAVELVKQNELYNESKIKGFQCDITTETIFNEITRGSVDIITLVFVLSAVHPDKFNQVAKNLFQLLKPGGILLFRDYGLYDMAQLRFKASNKIGENFYVRQDGTCSYFFSLKEAKELYESSGFKIVQNNFIERRTINKKEDVNVKRWFIQGKYLKPG